MLEDELERAGVENVLEHVGLVRDQVAERHANPGQRRFVVHDQRVAKGDQEQQLGEVKHVIAERVPGEHHPNAVPDDEDCGEGDEHRVPEPKELWFVGGQQTGDRLLDAPNDGQAWMWLHGSSLYGWRQARWWSAAPRRNPARPSSPSPKARRRPSCMFSAAVSVSRARLLSTSSCSTSAVNNCNRACFCRVSTRTAPLILSRTAVALWSGEGSVTCRSSSPIASHSRLPTSRSMPAWWVPAMIVLSARSSVASARSTLSRAAGGRPEMIPSAGMRDRDAYSNWAPVGSPYDRAPT